MYSPTPAARTTRTSTRWQRSHRSLLLCLQLVGTGAAAQVPEISGFTLIDADTDQPIAAHDPLVDGADLDPSAWPGGISVRANPAGAVGSVVFELGGAESHQRTESVAPYALFGDSNADYDPWVPSPGGYTLSARAHEMADGQGAAGATVTIEFTVLGGEAEEPPPDGNGSVTVHGTLMRWHAVRLDLDGPGATEMSTPNPFLGYRMQVLFTAPSGATYDVPGSFVGDGAGGSAGTLWRAILSPSEVGEWSYVVSFRSGVGVAVDLSPTAGTSLSPFDGGVGTFLVAESDKQAPDFRAPGLGLIKNRGHHYLTSADGRPWVKGGPDIPENFLGYVGFDNTTAGSSRHSFAPHAQDWRPGDPDWTSNGTPNAGRAIVGALNYIADRGANSIYFLPMNIGGDGKDTFPTVAPQTKDRFDLSKLWQWEQVLGHANQRGILLHFVLAETETANETYHDGGLLGLERKLYYRMLHARFGHLNASQWNLGEENDYSDQLRRDFAAHLKAVDPYDHPVTNHTKGGQYDATYDPLLGNADFDMTSFQGSTSNVAMFDLMKRWREDSAAAGVPWAISFDEPQKIENDIDDEAAGYPHGRRAKMWPVYLGGGAGFEWYVQQDGGGHGFDQAIDDFSAMNQPLRWMGHALAFLSQLPLLDMEPDRDLVSSGDGPNVYAMAQVGEVYAIYSADGADEIELDLTGVPVGNHFEVLWFDPRLGGPALSGSVVQVSGGGMQALGVPPSAPDDDWAVLVRLVDALLFADDFETGDLGAWSP